MNGVDSSPRSSKRRKLDSSPPSQSRPARRPPQWSKRSIRGDAGGHQASQANAEIGLSFKPQSNKSIVRPGPEVVATEAIDVKEGVNGSSAISHGHAGVHATGHVPADNPDTIPYTQDSKHKSKHGELLKPRQAGRNSTKWQRPRRANSTERGGTANMGGDRLEERKSNDDYSEAGWDADASGDLHPQHDGDQIMHDNSPPLPSEDPSATARSSQRTKRRPRRLSAEMSPNGNQALTGVLTPSSRKRGRPKKVVAFHDIDKKAIERQLGFRDISQGNDKFVANVEDVEVEAPPSGDDELPGAMPASINKASPRISSQGGDDHRLGSNEEAAPDTESCESPEANETSLVKTIFSQIEDHDELDHVVRAVRDIILTRLTGGRGMPLVGLDDEYRKLRQLVEQTIVAGEGNSVLAIGARGSGKTTMVEQIITDLSSNHEEDFHVVRLSGFVHTDDKVALRDIWKQLGREMEVDDDEGAKASNYADILLSLLALLSHPSEISDSHSERTAKSVIFILDEFDLFASHSRQTLLYNLFDIAQARKAPIAVIGVTTRVDVTDLLEKRVKSRFSHRHIHISLPKTFPMFLDICKQSLSITQSNQHELVLAGPPKSIDSYLTLTAEWNDFVQNLFDTDETFQTFLRSIFHRTKSVKEFYAASLLPIVSLTPFTATLTGADFISHTLAAPDSKLHLLTALSDLELSLLIAAARLDIILDTDTCNFAMAYDEYSTLAARVKVQSSASGAAAVGAGARVWSREVGLGAWETLAEYELIVPAVGAGATAAGVSGSGGGSGSRDVGRAGRMFRIDVALEEILPSVPGINVAMAKWCKEI
ncbi:MAG: hypothetical protein M1833_004606 [Piccolia ochrophora]|nr:MAG: hypothetical protein M1833_004606 [Piccolia ochrophora]